MPRSCYGSSVVGHHLILSFSLRDGRDAEGGVPYEWPGGLSTDCIRVVSFWRDDVGIVPYVAASATPDLTVIYKHLLAVVTK
jgi:hypothetical protein